jgi:hypothetical protein
VSWKQSSTHVVPTTLGPLTSCVLYALMQFPEAAATFFERSKMNASSIRLSDYPRVCPMLLDIFLVFYIEGVSNNVFFPFLLVH